MRNYEYGSIDNLKTSYLTKIDTYECLLKAWDAVTINYKKDGGHFANLQKNFSGAYVRPFNAYFPDERKILKVSCNTNKSGWQDNFINLFEYGPQYENGWRALTVDEIIAKIEKHKAELAGYIAGYQYKLANLDSLQTFVNSVQIAVDSLPKELRSDATNMLQEYYFHS